MALIETNYHKVRSVTLIAGDEGSLILAVKDADGNSIEVTLFSDDESGLIAVSTAESFSDYCDRDESGIPAGTVADVLSAIAGAGERQAA